jgi:hypothetical protein
MNLMIFNSKNKNKINLGEKFFFLFIYFKTQLNIKFEQTKIICSKLHWLDMDIGE